MKWLRWLFAPSPYRISDDDRRKATLSVLNAYDFPICQSDQVDYVDLGSRIASDAPPISEVLLHRLVADYLKSPRIETHCANASADIVIYRVVSCRERNFQCLVEWVSAFDPAENDYIRRHLWIEGEGLEELSRLPAESWRSI
jgi:hypothetical protein